MTLTVVENALKNNRPDVARKVLAEEWNRSTNDPAHIYYQVIRDDLVATFLLLESSNLCTEWDSFRYCSNAMLELNVKNVSIPEEMEFRVLQKLSSYGLQRLCGDPIKSERSWEDSVDLVLQWVGELRGRPSWYDFLDLDDMVMFRFRMIHNQLFVIKNHPAMREVPLKEMVFCLAIFDCSFLDIKSLEIFKIIINKRNLMHFLIAIASRLKAIRNPTDRVKHRHSSVLKKLRKAYRRTKQMYSVFKIVRCSQIYKEFDGDDYKRCNASATVAAFKRFNQVCGEAIKNTVDTPNLSHKLTSLLPKVLTNSILLNSKYRNVSSHGFPLSHLFVRDTDQMYYYQYLSDFVYMTAVSFYLILAYILHDCTRYMLGSMRRCGTIEDLRSLIRFMGNNKLRLLQEHMFEKVEQYLTTVKNRLNETDLQSLNNAQREEHDELWDNYQQKVESINKLRGVNSNGVIQLVEVMAFSNVSISAVNRLLDSKLTDKSSGNYFETLFSDWKVVTTRSLNSIEFNATVIQSYIHKYMELDHDATEQWRYRSKTKEILAHFTSDIEIDSSTLTALEESLHSVLSKSRNGYYQNIFALDAKSQAIIQTLKAPITGSKSSKEFKSRNSKFKTQLEALRRQDEQDLNQVVHKIQQNLRECFCRYDCFTIEHLIKNHQRIPVKALLAISFWQLQIMEICSASGYLGDNFCLLTTSVPMIWGKSYRNALAHDSLSYNLLTDSDSIKILINGFVLAFDSGNLNVFAKSGSFTVDGLVDLKTAGCVWLETQAGLLRSIRTCDDQLFESFLKRRAEPSGRYLLALGKLLRPMNFAIPGIIAHEQFDQNQIAVAGRMLRTWIENITDIIATPKMNRIVQLNLLQINEKTLQLAVREMETIQPHLMAPVVGAVLPHLVNTDNMTYLETILDLNAGANVKPTLLMTTGHTETERDFLEKHLGLRTSIIGEISDDDLLAIFTEEKPASDYELGIAVIRNDLRLFEHIVQNCYQTPTAVLDEFDLLQAMEICCCHGRLQMVRCLLANNILCEMYSMHNCLLLAIFNQHWRIVDLLLDNGAYIWLDEGANYHSILEKQNFKMIRKLKNDIPAHLTEKINESIIEYGSAKLIEHFLNNGMCIWNCENILQTAALNPDSKVSILIEDILFEPIENAVTYAECKHWINMLQNLRALMLMSIDSEFLITIMKNYSAVERWMGRVVNFLRIDHDHTLRCFHFEDTCELICLKLPKNYFQANEDQFKRIIQRCNTLIDQIKSIPPWLSIDKSTIHFEFCSPYETIEVEVDLTIFSTIASNTAADNQVTIVVDHFDHTADIISMGLRTFLLKFRHLKAASANVTSLTSPDRFHFFQIDSASCILQLTQQKTINLSYLLSKPGQYSIMHYLEPDSPPHLVEQLLQLGADPSLLNARMQTPFRTVLSSVFPVEIIKLMHQYYQKSFDFDHEISIFNIQDLDGYTPLHAAIGTNNYEVTEFLLENGADPTLADHTGKAAVLAYAILNRNVGIVELLIRRNPDLVKHLSDTSKQYTAFESAVKINHDYIVRRLLESGADFNHRNGQLFTPLKYAIEHDSVESLQVILEFAERNGVIVEQDVDGCGTTGLQYARQVGACSATMHLLVSYSLKMAAAGLIRLKREWKL